MLLANITANCVEICQLPAVYLQKSIGNNGVSPSSLFNQKKPSVSIIFDLGVCNAICKDNLT